MSDERSALTKWRTALVIGAGVAAITGVGILVYYLLSRSSEEEVPEADPAPQTPPTTTTATTEKSETTSTGSQGSLDRARAVKQQGNEFYKQQKFDEAIKCYKEAINVCPPSRTEDIAIFFQNLAAVYDMMATKTTDSDVKTSHLNQVVENCSHALTYNHRYVKALTRRLKAFQTLGRLKEAILDVTRVLVLDETQGRTLTPTVAILLKDFGQQESKQNFPTLGPLAPSRYLVKSFFESFCWSDDLSEARLKQLWASRVIPKPVNKEPTPIQTEDGDGEKPTQPEDGDGEKPTQPEDGDEEKPTQPEDGDGEKPSQPEDDNREKPSKPDVEKVTQPEDSDEPPQKSPDLDDAEFADEAFVKAAAQFRAQNYHGILEVLSEAVSNGNSVFVPHALLLRGAMYALWRLDQKGLKDLQDVVNTQGLSKELYSNALVKRASIMAGLGEVEKCHTCFTKALAIDPNCADVYIFRARLVLESEEVKFTEGVIQDLEKGLSLAPGFSKSMFLLATAYHRMASMQQSLQLLETAKLKFSEALQKNPNDNDGLLLYSAFLQDTQQLSEAEELINKAVKLEPENPIAHFTQGLTQLMTSQNIEKAISCLETAIAKDSSCVQAYTTLATIEMQRGNSVIALDMYDKAISFSRAQAEMAQAYISREVVIAQNEACREYNISPAELVNRAYGSY